MNNNGRGGNSSDLPDDLPEKSPARRQRPIPPAFKQISVNGCKTPGCQNFGLPPREGPLMTGHGRSTDGYAISGADESADLKCHHCRRFTRLKSNKAVHEEFERQTAYLRIESPIRCSDPACPSHSPVGPVSESFRKFGKTKSGSDRWQCRVCSKTFSVGKSTLYHQKPHTNVKAFELLINKVPISRMVEILGISYSSVYGKIEFLFEQCQKFAAFRENQFRFLECDRLYLCTDRQDYMVNWGDRRQRKTIQLTAIGTADLSSGYVFGLMPNFDPSVSVEELRRFDEADENLSAAMRSGARLWTPADYDASVARSQAGKTTARDDLDDDEVLDAGQQLPTSGAQVHADYLVHGHYWALKNLLRNVEKLRFFVDGDAMLLNACLGAFMPEIVARRVDIAVVKIKKEMTTGERQSKFAAAKRQYEADLLRLAHFNKSKARTVIVAERIQALRAANPENPRALQDGWLKSPLPDLAEPEKHIRFVTDFGDYDNEHVANLLMKATLWPIDTVFNRIRRRLALCERPIRSKRRASGLWHIYAPYDPEMIQKLLTIYRVWHNFVWINEKTNMTAAERIGLAKGKNRIEDIVYFDVRSP